MQCDCVARQHVGRIASGLSPSLQVAAQGGSPSGVLPIKQNLQRLIRRGIAVNEATQTPNKVLNLMPALGLSCTHSNPYGPQSHTCLTARTLVNLCTVLPVIQLL